jgi:hypothetical protein
METTYTVEFISFINGVSHYTTLIDCTKTEADMIQNKAARALANEDALEIALDGEFLIFPYHILSQTIIKIIKTEE